MKPHLALALLLTLPGCIAVGPTYKAPSEAGLQDAYLFGDGPIYSPDQAQPTPEQWWEAFSDPRIGQLVDVARDQNRDLKVAYHRLEAAKARAGAARTALLPQGGTSFSVTRQQAAQAQFAGLDGPGTAPDGPGPEFTSYQTGTQASWEIDLFGRLRRQSQSASARADEQEELLADTHRLITAQTVDTYLSLVEARHRTQVATENLQLQRRTLELTEELYALGEVPEVNVLQQRTLVRTTDVQLKEISTAVADAMASLAMVLGMSMPQMVSQFPDLFDDAIVPEIPSMSPWVALVEPEEMLRRRPDVRAAERALAAETFDIGIETAALFPQITLDGSASLTALDFSGLGDEAARGYTVGPSISWQIFSYPSLLKQRAAASAEARLALASYEQTVLQALTETDRILMLYGGSVERARLMMEAEETATRSAELIEARYREGADSLLSLLDAQRTALQTQDQAVVAKIGALRNRAGIHLTLAD